MIVLTRAEHAAAANELEAAIQAYRDRFNEAPHTWGFAPSAWPRLTAVLRQATVEGVNLTTAETYVRMGAAPPPKDALI